MLNINNGDNAEPLTIAANNKQSTQYFKFVDNEDGTYTIVTRASKDLSCVEIAGAQTSSGAVAQQWAWNDNACQKWVLEPVAYTLPSQMTTTTTTKPTVTTTAPVTSDSTDTTSETTGTYPRNYGDSNTDGVVDILDAVFLNKYLAGSVSLSFVGMLNSDCDQSHVLDDDDVQILMWYLLQFITDLPYTEE